MNNKDTLPKFNIIVAVDDEMGIGIDNTLPWRLKEDMKYFKNITTATIDIQKQNCVIMGRKTWESIPEKYRPLDRRKNIILTKETNYRASGALVCHDIIEALKESQMPLIENIFVIGGGEIYKEFMLMSNLDKIYITRVHGDFKCNRFFPDIPESFNVISVSDHFTEGDVTYWFEVLRRT